MLLINTQEKLNEICELLEQKSILAIDTEFERRSTYFSKLSIVQILAADSSLEIIIDNLAIDNLLPLKKILLNNNILKIFHSSHQDLEIFYHLFNIIPNNIFDTQIAAEVCGYGQFISYSNLCSLYLAKKINKKYQTADWMARPLTQGMLEYAINDVRNLIPIYHQLENLIRTSNLQDQYSDKMNRLLDVSTYKIDAENIWKRVKFSERSTQFITKMQVIAGYREECAVELDLPRRAFASDRDLVNICAKLPLTSQELQELKLEKIKIMQPKYMEKLFKLCAELKRM